MPTARDRALRAGLESFEHDRIGGDMRSVKSSPPIRLGPDESRRRQTPATAHALNSSRRTAGGAAGRLLAMRTNDEIGDDAFHQLEEELDWLEMAGGENREIDLDK